MRTRLKVCCIQSLAEAALAVLHGADALGLVAEMPTGPGPIGDELIREIAAAVPPGVSTFLLTSRTRAEDIAAHAAASGCSVVQIVDAPEAGTYELLQQRLPTLKVVQVIHVQDEASVEEARAAAPYVDALLLDSGRTRGLGGEGIRELGGTGRVHDWGLSREIVRTVRTPVYLAGGLTPGNVRHAVETVQPFGVDLCNGVRTAGQLDGVKLRAFVEALHG